MPLIKISYVVSFSSQDDKHPVQNLLKSQTGEHAGPWLCGPDEHSGTVQAEFQLERASMITHIDIGNCGSYSVEVLVGRSCWPSNKYITLLPAAVFVSAAACAQRTASRDRSVRMFCKDNFVEDARKEQWDRVRVVCVQPFRRDVPFGLAFVVFKSSEGKELDATTVDVDEVSSTRASDVIDFDTSPLSSSQDALTASSPGDSPARLSRAERMLQMSLGKSNQSRSAHVPRKAAERCVEEKTVGAFRRTRTTADTIAAVGDWRQNTTDTITVGDLGRGRGRNPSAPSVPLKKRLQSNEGLFDSGSIETHVDVCLAGQDHEEVLPTLECAQTGSSDDVLIVCPLCGKEFQVSEIELHASNCSL